MENFLKFVNGKKTSIATIASALLIFALGRGLIAQDVAELVSTCMVALGVTVNVYNSKK